MTSATAIDVAADRLLAFGEVGRHLPAGRNGASLHPKTVRRWVEEGVRLPDGTRLRLAVVRLPSRTVTSVGRLNEFIRRLNDWYGAWDKWLAGTGPHPSARAESGERSSVG